MLDLMHPAIKFYFRFHAAGQGIFASGTVAESEHSEFHWVFDCGSTYLSRVLRPKVRRFRKAVLTDTLDLLCISHFHNDHVSGLDDLIKGLNIGTIVMPYVSPLERLVLGCINGRNRKAYIRFLSDPVESLLERAASIGQIVLVGPSGGSGQDGIAPLPLNPFWEDRPLPIRFRPKLQGCPPEMLNGETFAMASDKGTALTLAAGNFSGSLSLGLAAWEFLFFHKPIGVNESGSIRRGVELILGPGNLPSTSADVAAALASKTMRSAIRKEYHRTLSLVPGESSNSTSLCVYAGPIPNGQQKVFLRDWIRGADVEVSGRGERTVERAAEKFSILYTGDADFRNPANRAEIQKFLTPARCDKVGVLQVPHHGSVKNWQVGKVREFQQTSSIFCASGQKSHYGHPDFSVWNDLRLSGRILVDASLGCRCHGAIPVI